VARTHHDSECRRAEWGSPSSLLPEDEARIRASDAGVVWLGKHRSGNALITGKGITSKEEVMAEVYGRFAESGAPGLSVCPDEYEREQ